MDVLAEQNVPDFVPVKTKMYPVVTCATHRILGVKIINRYLTITKALLENFSVEYMGTRLRSKVFNLERLWTLIYNFTPP